MGFFCSVVIILGGGKEEGRKKAWYQDTLDIFLINCFTTTAISLSNNDHVNGVMVGHTY